jgi:hypothetical protein
MRVRHASRQRAPAVTRSPSVADVVKPAGRFGFHFVEMCAVMCIGGGLLTFAFFAGASVAGYPDLRLDHPGWSAIIVSVILAATMVAWMRFRRMDWPPTLEMAGSSIAAGGLLVLGYWVGVVSKEALVPSVCLLACVAMVAVMLFRVPLYTSSHADHQKAS